jgi:hypothetical protein
MASMRAITAVSATHLGSRIPIPHSGLLRKLRRRQVAVLHPGCAA